MEIEFFISTSSVEPYNVPLTAIRAKFERVGIAALCFDME
jgi:hypothetical protein